MYQIIKNKLVNALRFYLVSYSNLLRPQMYCIIEYPKSGGTWLGQLISSYLEIPFPRNKMPSFRKSMFHGHYLPSKRMSQILKIYYLIRDGRDVMVSLYYHNLIWNDKNKLEPKNVLYYRKQLGFSNLDNIKQNLPKFIEFIFEHKPPKYFKFQNEGNWRTFNEKWFELYESQIWNNILIVRYEDLLYDTQAELNKLLSLTLDKEPDRKKIKEIVSTFSFENLTRRAKGNEDSSSFLRKGIAGDWRNKFTVESAKIFDHYAGDLLIKLGYEKNHSWIHKL